MSERSRFDAWSARLARSRDIVLVAFGGIYALGYLARALHAWQHNLGVLPGAELQYFIAGLVLVTPPALLVGVVYGIWRSLRFLVRWEEAKVLVRWEEAKDRPGPPAGRNRRASYVNRTVATTLGLGWFLTILGATPWLTRVTPDLARVGSRIGMVGFLLAFFCWIGIAVLRKDEPKASSGTEVDKSGRVNRFLRVLESTGTFLFGLVILLAP